MERRTTWEGYYELADLSVLACVTVRKVREYRSSAVGGILWRHCQRTAPSKTYAERGSSGRDTIRVAAPVLGRNFSVHRPTSDSPTTIPNAGASTCQPMPA